MNLIAFIMIVIELLNNFAEDAISLSGQDSELSGKQKFYAHQRYISMMIALELLNNFVEDAISLSGQRILSYRENKKKMLCSLAPPGGKISNLLARIMIVLELLNNFAEDAIFLNGQDPEISAQQKFYAHQRRLVAEFRN